MLCFTQMGLIILSLTYFVMYVCRFMYVNSATHHLRVTYMEEFVDMSLLAFWDQVGLQTAVTWLLRRWQKLHLSESVQALRPFTLERVKS